jgi:beta-lactamase regulating signal transducer with metallopeptidase domain
MMISELLRSLLALTLASSGAMLLALTARRPVQRWLGVATACSMWLLVPVSMLAVLLPHERGAGSTTSSLLLRSHPVSAVESVLQGALVLQPGAAGSSESLTWAACAWLVGAAALVCYFVMLQRAFVKGLGKLSGSRRVLRAQGTAGCPAVMGVLRPQLILPADFRFRYTRLERRLILSHERAHLRRGDTAWNALAALLRCLLWFNPLTHLAAACFRVDQELACDAAVMQRHPGTRRAYAAAMLKTQLADTSAPAGCSWSSVGHLKERLRVLARATPGRTRRAWGGVVVAMTCVVAGYTAWAAEPATTQPPAGTPGTVAGSPAVQEASRAHPVTLQIDGQELQFLAGLIVFDATAAFIDASGDGDMRGVRIVLHVSPTLSATIPDHSPAKPDWIGDLVVQADIARLTGFSIGRPPTSDRAPKSMTFGDGCTVTLRDRSGRDLWSLKGAKCSMHLYAPLAPEQVRNVDTHPDVDPTAILRAVWANLRHAAMEQGGSTLTQQRVRSYFLNLKRTMLRMRPGSDDAGSRGAPEVPTAPCGRWRPADRCPLPLTGPAGSRWLAA